MEGTSGTPAPPRQSAALTISNGLVRLMARYAGRGPTKARTTVNTNHVVCVFHDVLSKPEQHMVDAGRDEAVARMRDEVFLLMRDEAIAAVETTLRRTVVGNVNGFDLSANVAVAVFLLDPVPDDGRAFTAEADGESAF